MSDSFDIDTSPTELLDLIDEFCSTARNNPNKHFRALRNIPSDRISTTAVVKNGNEGDKYLSDKTTFLRFETLGDMLFDPSKKILNILVLVDTEETPIPIKEARKEYGHHRLATIPLDSSQARTEDCPLMTHAILQRHNLSLPEDFSVIKVLERRLTSSSFSIGCLEEGTPIAFGTAEEVEFNRRTQFPKGEMLELKDEHRVEEYKGLENLEIGMKIFENVKAFRGPEIDEPMLPSMSFRNCERKLGKEDVLRDEGVVVVVVVRIVPQLHSGYENVDFPRGLAVPGDIVIRTTSTTGSLAALRKGFMEAFKAFCEAKEGVLKGVEQTRRLFTEEGVKERWHVDFWLQPRFKGEGVCEGLVRMRGEDEVGMFLERGLVEEGGRGIVMYGEAHLVL